MKLIWTRTKSKPRASLLLAHGASGSPDSKSMTRIAHELQIEGIEVARFAFPHNRVDQLVDVFDSAFRKFRTQTRCSRVWIGGRSMGARVAIKFLNLHQPRVQGYLGLAYPIKGISKNPKNWKSRAEDVVKSYRKIPKIFVVGGKDPLSPKNHWKKIKLPPKTHLIWFPRAEHELNVASKDWSFHIAKPKALDLRRRSGPW